VSAAYFSAYHVHATASILIGWGLSDSIARAGIRDPPGAAMSEALGSRRSSPATSLSGGDTQIAFSVDPPPAR